MEKFPILCTLSAMVVFLGAVLGVAGVQTVKKNDLPFGLNSVEQIQSKSGFRSVASTLRQDVAAFRQLDLSASQVIKPSAERAFASRDATPVQISGDLLVSF